VLAAGAAAQAPVQTYFRPAPVLPYDAAAVAGGDPAPVQSGENVFADPALEPGQRRFLESDRGFPGFIGWVSNVIYNIDPRSLSQIMPVYLGAWTDRFKVLPAGNFQVIGPAVSLALTERLSIGLNRGGWAVEDLGRQREGWLDIGSYAQYTLIRDVPDQFLFTAGVQWGTPSGARQIFQGQPPDIMATYGTLGKEFGNFHVLLTGGYQFPLGSASRETRLFYGDLHLDVRLFGWLYPLVEFNGTYHSTTVDLSRSPLRNFIDIGSFNAQGNILVVAPGVNAVLIRDRLEFGGSYGTPIASQHNFNFNAFIVKMIVRF
jgi:hypothetical protein